MFNVKQPFYSRRNLILLITGTILFYVLCNGAFIAWRQYDKNKKVEQLHKANQDYWNNLSPQERAIKKSVDYLKSSASIKQNHKLFVDYLQRAYNLDQALSLAGQPFDTSKDPRIYPQEINYLERIAFPDRIVQEQPKNPLEGPTLTNVFSANCDHLPFPENFWQTIEQNNGAGDYYMTHNALAFRFMKDNGCPVPEDKKYLEAQTKDGMIKLAEDPTTNPDLRYEAIAFLCLSGYQETIQPAWIQQIIDEQNDDGSWDNPANQADTDHTTILALWAILSYNRPEAVEQSLIRRPNL